MLKFIIGYLRPLEMITIINYITIYTTQNRKQKSPAQITKYMYHNLLDTCTTKF